MTLSRVWLIVGAIIVGAVFFFVGHQVGYGRGYKIAYTSEHSHYLFEKKRSEGFQHRITSQRRCVSKMTVGLTPVEDGGFAGIGETIQRIAYMFTGTVRCDREANFGAVTPVEYNRIIPSSSQ